MLVRWIIDKFKKNKCVKYRVNNEITNNKQESYLKKVLIIKTIIIQTYSIIWIHYFIYEMEGLIYTVVQRIRAHRFIVAMRNRNARNSGFDNKWIVVATRAKGSNPVKNEKINM